MSSRPTHILIDRASRHLLGSRVSSALSHKRLSHLIENVHPPAVGRIDLSRFAADEFQVRKVVRTLISRGIDHRHIEVIYEGRPPKEQMAQALTKGVFGLNLDVGQGVAEKEVDLEKYFLKTPIYRRVFENKAHIIIGSKGSGKSAILRVLHQDRVRNSVVITPEHYATDVLESLNEEGVIAKYNAYISTWKYSLLIEIFRKLALVRRDKSTRNIRDLLNKYGHTDPRETIFDRFVSYLKKFTSITAGFGGAELSVDLKEDSAGDIEQLFRMSDLNNVLPELRTLLSNNPFYVFIDELDQSWDNNTTSNMFLISLFTAALQLRGLDPNLNILIFLRSEIFDLLKPQIDQLDKMRSDIVEIKWTERELQELTAERFRLNNEALRGIPTGTIIREIFGPRMYNTSAEVFEYLLSRTSMRPLEIIQLSRLVFDFSQRFGDQEISPDSISAAEEEFSNWKFDYFNSENMYTFPNIKEAIDLLRQKGPILSKGQMDDLSADFIIEGLESDFLETWRKKWISLRT